MADKNSIYKKINNLDEEFKLNEYTVQELEEMFNVKKNSKKSFKEKYFEFYDDVKSSSLKKQDW